jgi:hypothetical protein
MGLVLGEQARERLAEARRLLAAIMSEHDRLRQGALEEGWRLEATAIHTAATTAPTVPNAVMIVAVRPWGGDVDPHGANGSSNAGANGPDLR